MSNSNQPRDTVPRDHILVGVDASESSCAALAWAAGQSRTTGVPLRVVHAWTFVPYPYVNPVLARESAEEAARAVLWQAIDDAIGDDTVEIHAETMLGHPARVLADLGKKARMIVIGGGGHGELAGLLLGSVGLHLAAHAPVPLVIVPRVKVPATPAAVNDAETAESRPTAGGAPLYHPFTFY